MHDIIVHKKINLNDFQLTGTNPEELFELVHCDENNQEHKILLKDLPIEFVIKELTCKQTLPVTRLNISIFAWKDNETLQEESLIHDKLLNNLSKLSELLQHHPYMKQELKELKLKCGDGGIFNWSKVSGDFSRMLTQIKYTNINKLNISKCSVVGVCIKTLAVILPETQITHLNIYSCLICSKDKESVIDLFRILPNTQIAHLNIGDNFLKPQTLNELLKILPSTQITHLNISIISLLYGTNNCEQLLKQLIDILPQTNVIYFNIFEKIWNSIDNHIKQIQQLKDLFYHDLKTRNETIKLWFRVFKDHRIVGTQAGLFPEEISQTILSFLYPKIALHYHPTTDVNYPDYETRLCDSFADSLKLGGV